ncbi:MAG: hypothetical protein OK455_04440 [Thaumarchaeota archaeon]|nr:hypothetical protein [Nitrososphaerota archaeon]
MEERPKRAQLLKSSASSATRVLRERAEVASLVGDPATKRAIKQLVKPNSISGKLRSAGVALILFPEPFTAVPGAIMLGASFATKRNEPASISSLIDETSKLLDEIDCSI